MYSFPYISARFALVQFIHASLYFCIYLGKTHTYTHSFEQRLFIKKSQSDY